MPLKIVIVDYNAGNLRNVQKAFEHLGYSSTISNEVDTIKRCDVLVLPGVGAFHDGMSSLAKLGLKDVLYDEVVNKKKPILGICLGMQLMAEEGYEGGRIPGLGLLPMTIKRLQSDQAGLRLPHIGWNEIVPKCHSVLFDKIPEKSDFYFVHGYHAVTEDESIVSAIAEYGHKFVTAIEKDNIFATQFHPEKSQRYGLNLLKNFLSYCNTYNK